ncbi:MAG: SCP2 sterol-binding domain-containing protein [Candidatus Heimdallarchaeota archaeon]|nr:SCP2 sterol-binding domain-containing protein [Candidatus Heimdallarchaeota archaeon]MCK4876018.1 SCP2 sterol-binding domain-containing protein [Candidatus Heimdallarchaeota archaeon]
MVEKRREVKIKGITEIFAVSMITGFGLLGLATYLLSKYSLLENTNSLEATLILVFMIVFAVLGISLLLFGFIGSLSFFSKVKKIFPKLLESSISKDQSSSESQSRLQIIRPHSQSKSEKILSTEETVSHKTVTEKPSLKKEEPAKSVPEAAKTVTKSSSQIPSDFSYTDGIQNIVDRYKTEKVKKAFKNWHNTLMITFPDISKSFLFKINGEEGLELSEGVDENAAVQVKMDSTVFVKMMTKQINPIKAYSSGSLEVKGEMKNMLKLRKLMF